MKKSSRFKFKPIAFAIGTLAALSVVVSRSDFARFRGYPNSHIIFVLVLGSFFLTISFLPHRFLRWFAEKDEFVPDFRWSFNAFGITLVAGGLLKAIPHLYEAARHLSRVPLAVALAFLLLALGWLAHTYKQRSQYWYGFTEMIVAVLFILDRCMQLNSIDALPNNWGTLVGAVYFLARGLNNWREGESKRRTSAVKGDLPA